MSHLDEGTLHALLDGELETHEVAEIQAHLGSCSACGLRLREVKEFLAEADRLIASVELGGAAAPAGATPRAQPLGAERAESAEPVADARPEPPPRRERPQPRPPAAQEKSAEPWHQPPPSLLLPDNESPSERRLRRLQRIGWAAMIAVLLGAGFVQLRRFGGGTVASEPDSERPSQPGAVVSQEEAGQSDPSNLTRAIETLPSNIAVAESGTASRPAAPAAKTPPAKLATPPKAVQERKPTPAAASLPDAALRKDEAAARADSGGGTGEADSSGTENLADVRARASEALADLDRERRRNQAAAATAALDAERRRRAATQPPAGVAAARAEPAPTPPAPPTTEQRAQVYLRIGLDEASRQLGGPAHVIEGLSPLFMGLVQGSAVAGADATRPVVRVVYQDTQGRLIMLDQQRLRAGQAAPPSSPLAWTLGDTAMWLRGEAGADVLRTYRPRVR